MLKILLCVLIVIVLILIAVICKKNKILREEKELYEAYRDKYHITLDNFITTQGKLDKSQMEIKSLNEKLEAFTLTYSTLGNKYSKLEKTYNQLVEDTAEYIKSKEKSKEKLEPDVAEEKTIKKETAKKTTTKKSTTKKETSKKK